MVVSAGFVNAGDDIALTWPNIQPPPETPPTPPSPPDVPQPVVTNVLTLCELQDFGKRFNAVVFGDLTVSGGDSEGAILVWGNAILPDGYTVGYYSGGGEPTPDVGDRDDGLIVGGNLVIGAQPVNGNIVYGGTYQGPARWYNYALRHVEPVTIEGIAILGGSVVSKGGFEFHNFGLDVFFCPTVPEVALTSTAGFAPDGAIFGAAAGATVIITNYVSNPSEYWLRSVTLVGSDGTTVALGDLAPGASTFATTTVTSGAAGRYTYSATVTAAAFDSGNVAAFASRPSVTASDVAVVEFSDGSCVATVINGVVSNETAANSAPPAPVAKADYGVTEMWFSCVPTFAGETFTVNVRVANAGDADGEGAILGLYLVNTDHDATIASAEKNTAVRTVELGRIPAGQSRVYSFGGLTAPDTNGVCHVIAYADIEEVQSEYSKGDNQNNLTYELSQVNLQINVSAEGVTLTWSNGWGQKYSILGSNDLENWETVVTDIPSARDESGLVENTYTVGFDTGYSFFKLRVDQR